MKMRKLTQEDLDNYQNRLLLDGIFVSDQAAIKNILDDPSLQEFYLSDYFLTLLRWYIQNQDKIGLIDSTNKSRVYELLSILNTANKQSSFPNKKEIHDFINECIIECNLLNTKIDHNIYLAAQYHVRTGEYYNEEESYVCVTSSSANELVEESVLNDYNYLEHFLYYSPEENVQNGVYDHEYSVWSMNRFLYDFEQFEIPFLLQENCKALIKTRKKHLLRNYVKDSFDTARRVQHEIKSLSKKIR